MAEIASLRRFYLLKRVSACGFDDEALPPVWQSKQEAQPEGIALPDDFPSKADLAAVGYVATNDLIGADEEELFMNANLSASEAQTVFAALAALEET